MKPQLAAHLYVPDPGITDRPGGVESCALCPLPRQHEVHQLPPSPDGAAQYDARRLGETEER